MNKLTDVELKNLKNRKKKLKKNQPLSTLDSDTMRNYSLIEKMHQLPLEALPELNEIMCQMAKVSRGNKYPALGTTQRSMILLNRKSHLNSSDLAMCQFQHFVRRLKLNTNEKM